MSLSAQSPFTTVAAGLLQAVDAAVVKLRSISDSAAGRPVAQGKWSPKQIVGHLIDSASNNHQRFVRAQRTAALEFPGYEQDDWVSCQHYEDGNWADLITLWHAYNRHLAYLVEQIPEARADMPCKIGANAPVTLASLVRDYLVHLEHHLEQLNRVARGL
jgi:hypothetical protein